MIWNHDTDDWCLTPVDTNLCGHSGPANAAALAADLIKVSKLPKSPGLIILEHEITKHSVAGFASSYTAFKSAGWDMVSFLDIRCNTFSSLFFLYITDHSRNLG